MIFFSDTIYIFPLHSQNSLNTPVEQQVELVLQMYVQMHKLEIGGEKMKDCEMNSVKHSTNFGLASPIFIPITVAERSSA
jgi:hypothetical protein